jgi:hypothetical protein
MYFQIKNILKINHYYTLKHTLTNKNKEKKINRSISLSLSLSLSHTHTHTHTLIKKKFLPSAPLM